jgi:predicted DNA-binding WGR domain protein
VTCCYPQDYARQYLRFKACHMLVSLLTRWQHRGYRKAVSRLKAEMDRQRALEKDDAALTLQKHARGYARITSCFCIVTSSHFLYTHQITFVQKDDASLTLQKHARGYARITARFCIVTSSHFLYTTPSHYV